MAVSFHDGCPALLFLLGAYSDPSFDLECCSGSTTKSRRPPPPFFFTSIFFWFDIETNDAREQQETSNGTTIVIAHARRPVIFCGILQEEDRPATLLGTQATSHDKTQANCDSYLRRKKAGRKRGRQGRGSETLDISNKRGGITSLNPFAFFFSSLFPRPTDVLCPCDRGRDLTPKSHELSSRRTEQAPLRSGWRPFSLFLHPTSLGDYKPNPPHLRSSYTENVLDEPVPCSFDFASHFVTRHPRPLSGGRWTIKMNLTCNSTLEDMRSTSSC